MAAWAEQPMDGKSKPHRYLNQERQNSDSGVG
jgi:hypothetical protein